jgi:hypothetical protein
MMAFISALILIICGAYWVRWWQSQHQSIFQASFIFMEICRRHI